MSYEGYEQLLCKQGHYFTAPPHWDQQDTDFLCECGERAVWRNPVDETNYNSFGVIPLALLQVAQEEETSTCGSCGHIKVVEETRYVIPTKQETQQLQRVYQGEELVRLRTGNES